MIMGFIIYCCSALVRVSDEEHNDYNELLDPTYYRNIVRQGYSYMGDTNFLIMEKPQDVDSTFVEFPIRFVDERIIDQVEVFYVDVTKTENDGKIIGLSDAFYKPRRGLNKFKISQTLLRKGSKISIGFFWKSEFGIKSNPQYEKITYNISH